MAELNIKVTDTKNVSKDADNNKNTEEQTEEVKLDRKTEDTKETNNDSTISLKSFKMMDDKHRREDQSKMDNNMKTNRNHNYSEDFQEEVSAPKCYNCIHEVSEFLPWFCINIGRWCSNSFKRNCCFCCKKKIFKRKRGTFDEEDEVYWDGNVINEGDLTRYSLPVCVDDDGNEDDSIKIKFHRNEGFVDGDDIKIENIDFEKCNVNKEDTVMNKGIDHDTKTVRHDDNHRSNSHGHCNVQSYSHGNISHDHNNDLNKCDNDNQKVSGWSKDIYYDTKTITHDNHYKDFNKYDKVNKGDISMSKGSDHDTKTVTHDDNHHSYGHGHSDVHSSSHGDSHVSHDYNTHSHTSDSHVSHDNNTDTHTDTGYSGGDVGGCDTGGSDW